MQLNLYSRIRCAVSNSNQDAILSDNEPPDLSDQVVRSDEHRNIVAHLPLKLHQRWPSLRSHLGDCRPQPGGSVSEALLEMSHQTSDTNRSEAKEGSFSVRGQLVRYESARRVESGGVERDNERENGPVHRRGRPSLGLVDSMF